MDAPGWSSWFSFRPRFCSEAQHQAVSVGGAKPGRRERPGNGLVLRFRMEQGHEVFPIARNQPRSETCHQQSHWHRDCPSRNQPYASIRHNRGISQPPCRKTRRTSCQFPRSWPDSARVPVNRGDMVFMGQGICRNPQPKLPVQWTDASCRESDRAYNGFRLLPRTFVSITSCAALVSDASDPRYKLRRER